MHTITTRKWIRAVFAAVLTAVLMLQTLVPARAATMTVEEAMDGAAKWMIAQDDSPAYSTDNCWYIMDMARIGTDVPEGYFGDFESSVIAVLDANGGKLPGVGRKLTEYSKLILTLTSIGVDARNVDGVDLFSFISDVATVSKQGNNGPMWALLAYNSHPNYDNPETEQALLDAVINAQLADGGWTLNNDLSKVGDSDMTGMALYALAPYYHQNDAATAAIDRGLEWASANQNEDGGYSTMGNATCESTAQIVMALSSLGVDCATDARFIKNGSSALDALLSYYVAQDGQGGFAHTNSDIDDGSGTAAGEINYMATYQAVYALNAYQRMQAGQNNFFDMSDVTLPEPAYTLGDVDGESGINASDALMALRHSVQEISLEGNQFLAADVDTNGQVNASDALQILRYSVKEIDAFIPAV